MENTIVDINTGGSIFATVFWCCVLGFAGFISLCMITAKEQKTEKLFCGICSLFCFSTMTLFIFAQVFDSIKCFAAIIIAFGIGIFLFAISYRYIYNQCNIKINAIFKRYRRVSSHTPFNYYIIYFDFEYNGKKYEAQDLQYYFKDKIDNFFVIGNTYEVFINPKDPSTYCIHKGVKNRTHIILLLLAFIIVIFGIYRVITV